VQVSVVPQVTVWPSITAVVSPPLELEVAEAGSENELVAEDELP
jgi:hypothetical protein